MSEKRGFLGFFKGNSVFQEEEAKQREYAMSQLAKDENFEQPKASSEEFFFDDGESSSPQPSTISQEMIDFAKTKLEEVLKLTQFNGNVNLVKTDGDKLFLEVVDSDELGRVIGRDGANLEAFQTLTRAFLFKQFLQPVKVVLDAGSYRKKRQEMIKSQAIRAAKQVMERGKRVDLDPMNAAERRLVHVMFQNHSQVQTTSAGEGNDRHVVLERRSNGRSGVVNR